MPSILYKDASAKPAATASANTTTESTEAKKAETATTSNEAANELDEMAQIEKEIQELEKQVDDSATAASIEDEQPQLELAVDEKEIDEEVNITGQQLAANTTTNLAGSNMKALMDVFIAQLPNCVNRELIDKAAKEFLLNLNTKLNRKRLVSALFQVQRTRLDLLPFYARFLATLNPCMPEISTDLAALLHNDFRFHVRKKDQINIESKIKTARFIGELVKFDMFAKLDALNCLKTLLADFKHHNIEMGCNLLDVCGRFLYRNQESHQKLKLLLVSDLTCRPGC